MLTADPVCTCHLSILMSLFSHLNPCHWVKFCNYDAATMLKSKYLPGTCVKVGDGKSLLNDY